MPAPATYTSGHRCSRALRRRVTGGRRACAALLALVLSACLEGPFERTNALDPAVEAELSFTTVDTAFSQFELVEFQSQITGAVLPPNAPNVDYRAEGPFAAHFLRNGPTSFRVSANVTVDPVTVPIRANLANLRFATRTVVVMQRPRRLFFTCSGPPCGTLAQGNTRPVNITMLDSLDWPLRIPEGRTNYATIVSRDTNVVAVSGVVPGNVQFQGRAAGQAWVVAGNALYRDSVLVTVTVP